MILWILYYIIAFSLIFSFLFFEKDIINILNKGTKYCYDKLNLTKLKEINIYIEYISYIIGFILLALFIFKVDRKADVNVNIKIYAVYISAIVNILSMYIKKYNYTVILLDVVLLFASTALFNINDIYFNILISISIIVNVLYILFKSNETLYILTKIVNGIYVLILVLILQLTIIGNYVIPTGSMLPTIQLGDRIFSNNVIYKFSHPKIGDIISFKEPQDNKLMYTKRITGKPGTYISLKGNHIYSNKDKISDREYVSGGYLETGSTYYIPQKGDKVSLYSLIRYNKKTGVSIYYDPNDFLNEYKDRKSYEDLFGLYSKPNDLEDFVFEFILYVEGKDYPTLEIQDFKYDKKLMDKLLKGEKITLNDNYYMAMGDNSKDSLDSRYFGLVKESRIKGKLLIRWFPLNRLGKVK